MLTLNLGHTLDSYETILMRPLDLYVPTNGGSGLKYATSTIIYLKEKREDGKAVIGNIVKAKTHKSRLSKASKKLRFVYTMMNVDLIENMNA